MKIPTIKGDLASIASIEAPEFSGVSSAAGPEAAAGPAPGAAIASNASPEFQNIVGDVAAQCRSGEIASAGQAVEQIVARYIECRYNNAAVPQVVRDHMQQMVAVQLRDDPLFRTLFHRVSQGLKV